jgi:hypothetical protein
VNRGRWILENLVGAPPPPPPPNVPALTDKSKKTGQPLTMREAMAQHRENPSCGSCHSQMDPLGFALEQFDAVGRWRDIDDRHVPIDASGVLPGGTKFVGVTGLRRALLARPDQMVTVVTEKLLTYAIGRGTSYRDMPSVRTIVRDAAPGRYRLIDVLVGIVKSAPFQMRRSS